MIINIVTVMMIEEWAEIYYFEFHTYVSSTEGSKTIYFGEAAPVENSPQGIIMIHCTIIINVALATNLRCGNNDEQRSTLAVCLNNSKSVRDSYYSLDLRLN